MYSRPAAAFLVILLLPGLIFGQSSSEVVTLSERLQTLRRHVQSLVDQSKSSERISGELMRELRAARQEVSDLRKDLQGARASLSSFEQTTEQLGLQVKTLSSQLEISSELSRQLDSEIRRWKSRSRRRLWILAALGVYAAWKTAQDLPVLAR